MPPARGDRAVPGRSNDARGGPLSPSRRRRATRWPWADLGLIRIMRKTDAVPFRIAQVERPEGPVDDLDPLFAQPALPGAAVVGRDAQREQVQAAVRIAERRGQPVDVARLQRDELLTLAHGEPYRALAGPPVLERPAAHHLQAQHVGVEAHRARQVLDLDGKVVMSAHAGGHDSRRVYESTSRRVQYGLTPDDFTATRTHPRRHVDSSTRRLPCSPASRSATSPSSPTSITARRPWSTSCSARRASSAPTSR